MEDLSKSNLGVLNNDQLRLIIEQGFISNFNLINKGNNEYEGIDGSSIELHTTNEIFKMKSTKKLQSTKTVEELIKENSDESFKQGTSKILKKREIYIIKLKESIAFNKFCGKYGLYGVASGKSSIGRLDVLTRLIVDYCPKYDEIPPDYNGDLYLEVIPLSFDIELTENCSLNQLRIFHGKPELSLMSTEELQNYAPMLYTKKGQPILHNQRVLRVDLREDNTLDKVTCAFKAKDGDYVVKLDKKIKHPPANYWEKIPPIVCLKKKEEQEDEKKGKEDDRDKSLTLKMESNQFFILRSFERMLLPNDVAVICLAYTENLGEIRIHYAGFAHPNFGHYRKDKELGAPLIFEARCHSFSVNLINFEQFARIDYYKMSKPTNLPSGYSTQELTLSSYFNEWDKK